jgi:hypothetical protein
MAVASHQIPKPHRDGLLAGHALELRMQVAGCAVQRHPRGVRDDIGSSLVQLAAA